MGVGKGGRLVMTSILAARDGPGRTLGAYDAPMSLPVPPDRLPFTGNPDADRLLAEDPLALLIGFALDQQVTVQKAFAGPLELRNRIGSLDAATIATMDPEALDAAFRDPARAPPLPRQHGQAGAGPVRRHRGRLRRRRLPYLDRGRRRPRPPRPADRAARHRRDEGRDDHRAARQAVRRPARGLGGADARPPDAGRRGLAGGAGGVPGGQAGDARRSSGPGQGRDRPRTRWARRP